jgi:hypothetical protein
MFKETLALPGLSCTRMWSLLIANKIPVYFNVSNLL